MIMINYINKNNELIAKFIGCEIKSYPTSIKSPFHGKDIWWSPPSSDSKTRTFFCEVGKEYFHDSWDWLMPVVEKISSICDEEFDEYGYYEEHKETIISSLSLINGITPVYESVISFIKWYNKQKE
jgi:hypothetical protein